MAKKGKKAAAAKDVRPKVDYVAGKYAGRNGVLGDAQVNALLRAICTDLVTISGIIEGYTPTATMEPL